MQANWTENVQEDHMSGTEHFCSSSFSCQVEDHWPESMNFSTLNNAGEKDSSKILVKVPHLDSECSDVDLDNDWVESEDSDSGSSIHGSENKKENKWLHPFFDMLKHIPIDPAAVNAQDTLFYCPACRGSGLGEVSMYKGFKPLIAHAKEYKQRRVKLHRDFAAILEEDLKGHGILVAEPGRMNLFCEQISLIKDEKFMNPLIVWPPTVVIQTTGIEVEGHPKRKGLKNREILEIFKEFHPKKVTQAYVHEENDSLLSLLVFWDSLMGYMSAKWLAKSFKLSKRGRSDWDSLGTLKVQPGSEGVLYGYMAKEEDMLLFNTHDARKRKVKWELKRYQDVVMDPLMQMHEAKMENSWLKTKLQKQEEKNKEREKLLCKLYVKRELEAEEIDFVSQIATKHLEATLKEMETNCNDDGDGW